MSKELKYHTYNTIDARKHQAIAIMEIVIDHPETPKHTANALWGAVTLLQQANKELNG